MDKWKKYAIMHKDRKVASINSDGSCTIYYSSFLPYNLYLEESNDIDTRLNNLFNFYAWCSSRVLTLDRKYSKEILNALGMKQGVTDRERAEIAISYHCVSFMDVYWVKSLREKVVFDDVNLYRHSLTDAFVDVSLRGRALTVENSEMMKPSDTAPDVGTPGVAPKAWVRRDGTFKLFKDGQLRDVQAEILASKILDCFDVEHVHYEADAFDGLPVSACRIITSEMRSIIPAEYAEIFAINHNTSVKELALKKSSTQYYLMNIMDYLLGNNDRHWGNWGFWVDNRNNRMEGLYPLMDFNKAFSAYETIDGAMCLPEGGRITQREAAKYAVKQIGLPQVKPILREWFYDDRIWDMFNRRLDLLKALL